MTAENTLLPKPYSVTPGLRNVSQFYSATFRDARGERVTRGLGTALKSYAFKICEGLLELRQKNIQSAADRPETVVPEADGCILAASTRYRTSRHLMLMQRVCRPC